MMAVMAFICVKAQEATAFQDGENKVASFSALNAYYDVVADGNINIEVAGDLIDVKVNGTSMQYTSHIATGNKFIYNLENLKKGDKITFASVFVMNDVVVTITPLGAGGVMEIKLVDATPKNGAKFGWNYNGDVTLLFNMSVNASKAKVIFGNTEVDASGLHPGNAYLSCNISTQLNKALKAGEIKAGDNFKVRFEGVADLANAQNLYNGDGIVEMTYIAPEAQTELLSVNFGTTIKSYYASDDTEGVFTMTFNDDLLTDIDKQGYATLSFGNIDLDADNLYYRENLPLKINGKEVSVDLRNKIRTVRSMLSGDLGAINTDLYEVDLEHISLSFTGIIDANGNYVSSPGQGTVGSFSYSLTLVMPDLTNFICEVAPQSSTSNPQPIKDGDKIEFWFSDANLFTVGTPGGFSFSYGEGENAKVDSLLYNYLEPVFDQDIEDYVYVPATGGTDLISIGEVDEYGGRSIWLTVPMLPVADGASVKIAPVGIVTVDGVDHCAEYAQTYNYKGQYNAIEEINTDIVKGKSYNIAGQQVTPEYRNKIIISNNKKTIIR